jgi:hypothetical protein
VNGGLVLLPLAVALYLVVVGWGSVPRHELAEDEPGAAEVPGG